MTRSKKSITEEIINLSTDKPVKEEQAPKSTDPVNIELQTPVEEPVAAPEAVTKQKIETDVRSRLSKRSVEEDVFVPTNPVALEKEAKAVAREQGFELNRGTSVGARLMARRRLG